MICGGPIVSSTTSYVFQTLFGTSFGTRVMGLAFSQTGISSATVQRVALESVSKTGFSLPQIKANMVSNGAFYIAIGY